MRLTTVPVAWSRGAGQGEPICYSVEGLPPGERAMVSLGSAGWRLVTERLRESERQQFYASPDEALAALKASVELAEKPPTF